jgi:phosphatidylglycerol:prolipoprotein diacylglycerol transferase
MYPILFEFGSFQIQSYGLIVGLSFLLALWMSAREAKKSGLDPKHIQDFSLYAFLAGVVGARLYFVLFSEPAYFLEHPGEIVAIWNGGMGIIGSLIGGLLAAAWFCRKTWHSTFEIGRHAGAWHSSWTNRGAVCLPVKWR